MIDMRFARPEFLFCLLLIPPLIVFFIKSFRKKGDALSQFGELVLIKAVSSLPSVRRLIIKTVFCTLSLIFIIIALAQPQSGITEEKVKGDSIDIVFAIDTSLSMLADDVKPSRLGAAKKDVYNLLNSLKGERVGIVAFSGTALALCPLTVDYNVTRYFLDTLDSDTVITLGTSLSDAVEVASRLFDELSRVKTVVILSDGEEHETGITGLEKIANKAKTDGIRVFALGIGTTTGSHIPIFDEKSNTIVYKKDKQGELIKSKLEESTLGGLCSLTEGRYYRFSPPVRKGVEADLKRIYTDILKISKKIPKTVKPKKTAMIYKDRFQHFTFLALIFLLLRILIPAFKSTKSFVGATRWVFPTGRLTIIPLILAAFLGLGWVPWNPAASRIKEGNRLFNEKRYEDAFLKYKEAQQYAPDQPIINFNIGNTHYLRDSYNKALEEFDAAIHSDDKALQANALFNRGNAEYRLGLLNEAAQSYKKVLELNPSDQDARYNLEFVKRELLKRKKEKKDKPPTPEDKEEKKEKDKDKPAEAEKEMQPAGGLAGKQEPKDKAPGDSKKEKKPTKEPKSFTPEQAFDFLKAHKPKEQEEQKVSGWFRLRRKHLEKDW